MALDTSKQRRVTRALFRGCTSEQLAFLVALEITHPSLGSKRYLSDVQTKLGFDTGRFQQVALSCHRDGLAVLSRDDLTQDYDKSAASEFNYLTESFHFVEPAP